MTFGTDGQLVVVLRVAGASQVLLGLAHVVLWRLFRWTEEIAKLSPLTARVFAVHTFFIAFLLVAGGTLGLARADLLAARGELAFLLLASSVAFWMLRLVLQPLVFDPILLRDSPYGVLVRRSASLLFGTYVLVYGWALARQLG